MAKAETITHQSNYPLRNDDSEVFAISASVSKSYDKGDQGAEITASIQHPKHGLFTYVVEFGGEFVKTKKNFTPSMYLHTALSIVQAQLESKRYSDCRISVHRDSGLSDVTPLS